MLEQLEIGREALIVMCRSLFAVGSTMVGNFRPGLLLALCLLIAAAPVHSQLTPGSMDVHWDEGSPDCSNASRPPLQVHSYNAQTFILRENLCSTFEAPFMYLLIGSTRALLIDTGDVADPNKMPLAKTVLALLPGSGSDKLPLLVVHTHRHLDHRAGDGQFTNLPNVQVVGYDLDSVRHFYGFTDWPNSIAQINLGDRIVDVIPTPGHNSTEVSFYDRNTGLFFTGDFLLPARLLVDDTKTYLASAQRAVAFAKDRPVSYVLGGHIELDDRGNTFPWQSQYHPHERVLQMTKGDLVALPAALRNFNGFYNAGSGFILINSIRILIAVAVTVGALLIAFVVLLVRFLRKRARTKSMLTETRSEPA
jgi:hydroxyacylglutathione hydrolase